MKPIFIIGGSRTGSTFLQYFLGKYTEIDIMPEMHILTQPWLRKSFASTVKENFGSFVRDEDIDELISLMYSKTLFGVFWNKIHLSNINISSLKQMITVSDRSIKSIFIALLVAHAEAKNKKICGAKFPVPMTSVDVLIKCFPECKIIHTVRDPRACFSSQFYKYFNHNTTFPQKAKTAISQFVYMNLQFYWSFMMFRKLKNLKRYYLCKYEDLILYPEQSLKSLCNFLEIQYIIKMRDPSLPSISSYAETRGINKGFQLASVFAWRKKLPPVVSGLIKIINYYPMKKMGFS